MGENEWPKGVTQAKNLGRHRRKHITMLGMLITYKRTRTGKGELMKFITLEDPTGTFEVTLFPKTYQRFGHLLNSKGPFWSRDKLRKTMERERLPLCGWGNTTGR